MLVLISSIPTTVRQGFDVQDLPSRSVTLSAEDLSRVFGGCVKQGRRCGKDADCCCNKQYEFNCVLRQVPGTPYFAKLCTCYS
jgi:hypothetical protein